MHLLHQKKFALDMKPIDYILYNIGSFEGLVKVGKLGVFFPYKYCQL